MGHWKRCSSSYWYIKCGILWALRWAFTFKAYNFRVILTLLYSWGTRNHLCPGKFFLKSSLLATGGRVSARIMFHHNVLTTLTTYWQKIPLMTENIKFTEKSLDKNSAVFSFRKFFDVALRNLQPIFEKHSVWEDRNFCCSKEIFSSRKLIAGMKMDLLFPYSIILSKKRVLHKLRKHLPLSA